ncbi:hypothetical protein GCM10027018_30150 [Paenibacillus thermoaerophilus]
MPNKKAKRSRMEAAGVAGGFVSVMRRPWRGKKRLRIASGGTRWQEMDAGVGREIGFRGFVLIK